MNKHVTGRVYIVSVHDWHHKKGEPKFYNVRAECIGQNNAGNIGYFADIDGSVFHNSDGYDDYLESQVECSNVLSKYPLSYGVWRKVQPPASLQTKVGEV